MSYSILGSAYLNLVILASRHNKGDRSLLYCTCWSYHSPLKFPPIPHTSLILDFSQLDTPNPRNLYHSELNCLEWTQKPNENTDLP